MTTKNDKTDGWKQYWTPIGERRGELRKLSEGLLTPHEFHILGAGVTGLAAAIEVLNLPLPGGKRHSVTIYEATDRLGGRINTKRLGPKPEPGEPDTRPYFERGAMRIHRRHDYTWAYAREIPGLLRRPFRNTDQSHHFLGQVFVPPDMAKLARLYEVKDEEAARGPGHLFFKNVLGPEMQALDAFYRDRGGRDFWAPKLLDGCIEGAALRRVDTLSLKQVLDQRLRASDPGQIRFLAELSLAGLLDRAFLMFIRSWLINSGSLYELCRDHGERGVVGGMDLLVDGMRDRIEALAPRRIQLKHEVMRIASGPDNAWQVDFANGLSLRGGASEKRHLLCTLPFTILREIELQGFSNAKLEAIRGLSNAHATKVALHVKERFWEQRFKGGRSLNDRLTRSSYYPNDCKVEPIPEGEPVDAAYDLYTQPLETGAQDEGASAAPEAPAKPWLLLSSYTFGEHAEAVGKRPPLDTVPDLRSIFPQVDRFVVEEESETWYWNVQPFAKGPFALPTPGNVGQFYQTARKAEGGISFAGDHVSPTPGWIQGSLYSALWSMKRLLETITGSDNRS